jgi:hypothetical protein
MDFKHFSQPEWKEYKLFNESRYSIQDNEPERIISDNPIEFGWNKTEYRLFDSYNFISLDSFSGERLKAINDQYRSNSKIKVDVNIYDIKKRLSTYFGPFSSVIYSSILIFLHFLIYFFIQQEKYHVRNFIFLTICSAIFNGILVLAITIFLRLPERIVFPFAFFFPAMITLLAVLLMDESRRFESGFKMYVFAIPVIFVYILLLWPSINHLYTLKINPAYTSFWGEQKKFFEKTASNKILVGNASQFKSIWSNPYSRVNKDDELTIYPLGWYTFSPYWIQRGKLLGIGNIEIGKELIENNNLVWVSDDLIGFCFES